MDTTVLFNGEAIGGARSDHRSECFAVGVSLSEFRGGSSSLLCLSERNPEMLMKKSSLLIAVIVALALVTYGDRTLLSVPPGGPAGPGGSPAPRWRFTYPLNGSEVSGQAAFIGTGPSRATAMLSIYTQENTIPGGVYPSEITLKASRLVDTIYYDVWSSEAYGWPGMWFATIVPYNLSGSGGLQLLEVSIGDPSTDLDSLATLSGGDAVSYRITNPANPGMP
jgi:hypothetical protein